MAIDRDNAKNALRTFYQAAENKGDLTWIKN